MEEVYINHWVSLHFLVESSIFIFHMRCSTVTKQKEISEGYKLRKRKGNGQDCELNKSKTNGYGGNAEGRSVRNGITHVIHEVQEFSHHAVHDLKEASERAG